MLATSIADLRYGARRLRRNPGFTAVAVITLALGIGASTAIFSAIDPILFETPPYPRADRIMSVSDVSSDGKPADIAFANYREIAQRNHSFETLAVFKPWQPTLLGDAEPERLDGQRVSAGFFRSLGITPRLGRDFDISDDRVRGPAVAVLSDGIWKRRFGANPAILGQPITLDGVVVTVIGVLPPGFEDALSPTASVWAPLQYDASLPRDGREWGHHLRMIGRLRDGISVTQASRELDAIARSPRPEFPRMPWASLQQGVTVAALQDNLTHGVKPALLAVLGAVAVLLAIACLNVVNLLIARGAQRRGELAMRVALGAGAARLIRQVLIESLLIAGVGGALGMAVAAAGVRALVLISPAGLPRANAMHVDARVLVFGFVLTTAIGVLVGIIPALGACRDDPRAGLHQGTRHTAGAGHERTRSALVVGEVSLALVLLVSAGLLLRSLERLFAIAPGFEPSSLISMQVQASGARFADAGATNRYFADALDAVRRVPGVASAGFTSQLPLSGDLDIYGASVEIDRDQRDKHAMFRYAVSPGYLEAMRIPLVRGRALNANDGAEAPHVALVSASFVAHRFASVDPIGRRVQIGGDDSPWMTIVGITGDVKQESLMSDATDAVYLPATQWAYAERVQSLVVRVRAGADAASLSAAVRSALWSVDRSEPIVRVATMDHLVAATAADRRFTFVLFESFALAALLLAAIGIYGVLSGSVTERMREIGVRAALGATRSRLLGLVLRQGLTLAAAGAFVGICISFASSRALATLIFGVSRVDPVTYAGVVVLLLGVSAMACWVPAWRAAGVDPASTLRAD